VGRGGLGECADRRSGASLIAGPFSYDATRIGFYLWQASFIAFILWAYAAREEAQGREQKPDPMTDLA
jgi:hypothetical protein